MMVSGQERSIVGKNRLPSHLDTRFGLLDDSEAPWRELGWKPPDGTGLAKRCRERRAPQSLKVA